MSFFLDSIQHSVRVCLFCLSCLIYRQWHFIFQFELYFVSIFVLNFLLNFLSIFSHSFLNESKLQSRVLFSLPFLILRVLSLFSFCINNGLYFLYCFCSVFFFWTRSVEVLWSCSLLVSDIFLFELTVSVIPKEHTVLVFAVLFPLFESHTTKSCVLYSCFVCIE